jgi:hypothetical protein
MAETVKRVRSPVIEVSALAGTGVRELAREIEERLGVKTADKAVIGLFTERQARLAREILDTRGDLAREQALLAELLGAAVR